MALAIVKAGVVVVGTLAIARFVVPFILDKVDASRSHEVFLLAILGLCIGTAWLTSLAGLSLALGAFLGGMVVADTQYGHRAMGDILPLRHAFVSVFFVSLGMLFDFREVLAQPLLVGALLFGFLFAKGFLATLAALAVGFPARVAWLSGLGLAQFGEFGFVLTRIAREHELVQEETLGPLLTAGVLSMFLTPLLARMGPHIRAGEVLLAPLERLMGARGAHHAAAKESTLIGHVIVIGFGLAGELAARSLAATETPFVVLELNSENVRRGRELGYPVYYGDATSGEALEHAHIRNARQVVLLINDGKAAERVVDTIRRVAPHVPILMRTKFLGERQRIIDLGAHDVVAEEVEGGIEVVARLLRSLQVPRNVLGQIIRELRDYTQHSGRQLQLARQRLGDFGSLAALRIESALVQRDSLAVGQSAASMQLRKKSGAHIIAVKREGELLEGWSPEEPFVAGDIVFFVGTEDALAEALVFFGHDGHH